MDFPIHIDTIRIESSIIYFKAFIFGFLFGSCFVIYYLMSFPVLHPGANPEFLERGFIYKGVGGSLCRFYLIFLKYPMKMK